MKLVIQKNHLGGQILSRSSDPVKKRRHYLNVVLPEDVEYRCGRKFEKVVL